MIPPPVDNHQLLAIEEGEELVAYRNVKSDNIASAAFLDSLRSNAELGRPMRGLEVSHPLIYTGISAWEQLEQAVENAKRFPPLGDFVAEIQLDSASNARHYPWGVRPGHLTIWADPLTLLEGTASIIAVG